MKNDPALSLFISEMGGHKPFLPQKVSPRGSEVCTQRSTNERWAPVFLSVKWGYRADSLASTCEGLRPVPGRW